jgi:recombination protein RecR
MLPSALRQLVQAFSGLPGVGEKSALRFALHLVLERPALLGQMSIALEHAAHSVRACQRCGNIATADGSEPILCNICSDPARDNRVLCVVARIQDLFALERSGAMRGRYFVLGRLLSPIDGVSPEDLPIAQLRACLHENITEVVIATPPSVAGEATALHLARELGDSVTVSRIASGVPHGGELEFADAITLGRAISGRQGVRG